MLIAIGIVLLSGGLFSIKLINWYKLLNVNISTVTNLTEVISISFCFFGLNFILKFIGNVFQALQIPSAMYIMNFLGHLLSLLIIYFLKITTTGNLLLVAIVYSASPPLIYLLAYPITFYCLFKKLAPSFKFFDKECIKGLFNLSIIFFLLQMASLILFSLSNLIISNLFSPAEVTPYNIVQRYFSIIPMITNIIIAPMWSATTDAYTRGDFLWINRISKKLKRMLGYIIILLSIMVVISPIVYRIWIGKNVGITFQLSILMAIYSFIIMWSHSYSYLLNGMGKLKLQTLNTIIVAILFYPLIRFLGHQLMVPGILIGMCVLNLSGAILNTIQFNKVINKAAVGIWNK